MHGKLPMRLRSGECSAAFPTNAAALQRLLIVNSDKLSAEYWAHIS